ncbi:MAG: GntR family transcriptional regulator, partial [Gammaproteobacteria bacterium]
MKVSERIRLDIEEQIHTGGLLPGDPIDEARLMGQFGVSRTPVREALLQLKSQGLLTSLPRGGVVVAKMDVQQLFAMWELLAELESLCARYACERMSDHQRSELARVHEAAEAVVASDDREGWQAANLAFHESLYEGARNPYLRQEILRMRVRTQAYRRHAFGAVGQLRTSHHHHGLIL